MQEGARKNRMNEYSVCAGIVTFNPDIELLNENIDAIINQVDSVFIFDNGSQNKLEIQELVQNIPNINVEFGQKNFGIAFALNQILNFAKEKGYSWFLTLDQDSICSSNLINEYEEYMNYKDVAVICPFVLNNTKYSLDEYNLLRLPKYNVIKNPNDCITSASLNNVQIIDEMGGYLEPLFIDYVDTELNCRIIQNGYKILQVNGAYLIQSMGKAKSIRVFSALHRLTGLKPFRKMKVASVYNDFRLYYQARNSRYVYKKHANAGIKLHPIYMYALFLYYSVFYPKSRSRRLMWSNIIKGRKDGQRMIKDDIWNNGNL